MTEQELIRRLRDERPAPPAGFEERQDIFLAAQSARASRTRCCCPSRKRRRNPS